MAVPQSAQKRPVAAAPQAGHTLPRGVPHEGQNRADAEISSLQPRHVGTPTPSAVSDCNGGKRSLRGVRDNRRVIAHLAPEQFLA